MSNIVERILQQDSRLAPAYFSLNYKYSDQLLQTVKNKTTVLILVFKEFLQTSIRPLTSVLYAKGYHNVPLKNFCLTVPKNFIEEPFCVSENFRYRNLLGIREGAGITIFCQTCFVSSTEKLRRGTLLCFTNFQVPKKIMNKRGGGGRDHHNFLSKIFCLTVQKKIVGEPFCAVFQKNSGSEKAYGRGRFRKGEKFQKGEISKFPLKIF